jgi:hypothetical protein
MQMPAAGAAAAMGIPGFGGAGGGGGGFMSNLSPINLMTGGLAHVVFSNWTVVFWEGTPRHVCDDILHNRLWVQQQQSCIGASYQKEHTS